MMNNKFLSIIVPCYNSVKYLPKLLDSITRCNNNDDIEVILVDDHSDEDTEDDYRKLISNYDLSTVFIRSTEHFGCPAHGRNLGVQHASGQYITFVDHDDHVDPEGIDLVHKFIKGHNYPELVVTGIRQVDLEGNTQQEAFNLLIYTHGKFYNRTKFWQKYDIKFKDDMYYLEDMYMSCLTSCILAQHNIEPKFTEFTTYIWTNNPNSLGHQIEGLQNKEHIPAVVRKFKTYLSITEDVLFNFWDNTDTPKHILLHWMIRNIFHSYFAIQYSYFCKDKLIELFKPIYSGIAQRAGYSDVEFWNYLSDLPECVLIFSDELAGIQSNVGLFDTYESIEEFMELYILPEKRQ